jgi:hypothetical protein
MQVKKGATTSLLDLKGSGKGLWGNHPAKTIQADRDEWA